ncbi:MAG: hypothetical protein KJ947_22530 [Alphaproteobacteria bacterium]|nr:hypothetical protein [Alphaproteobacteria bacterium]MBU1552323.1 hypothetical protein [Alphaproteobacteria bacterium]MBU2334516.1 hypothetical protein [Alphaproteobacteria bacterium]
MHDRKTWKAAEIRTAALIAKKQNVVIELRPDGTIVILPDPPAPQAEREEPVTWDFDL